MVLLPSSSKRSSAEQNLATACALFQEGRNKLVNQTAVDLHTPGEAQLVSFIVARFIAAECYLRKLLCFLRRSPCVWLALG